VGGDRRTFREALHFLPVEIEIRRVALLPDVNAARFDLEPLGLVQTAGDEREELQGHGMEEDVGVPGRANADVGVCWRLHGSLEGREQEGGRRDGAVERVGEQEERGGV